MPDPGIAYRNRLLLAATACGGLGVAAFAVDLPVAEWAARRPLPHALARLLYLLEIFGHGLGVTALFLALPALDPSLRPWPSASSGSRRDILRMAMATAAGGLVVNLIKLLVERVRPHAADLPALASALDTFGTTALATAASGTAETTGFPSGHAALAAGFASALGWKYPHGRAVFAAFAALVAAQRVVSSDHFPSDVCIGLAVGLAAAAIVLGTDSPLPARMAVHRHN
jgi:undecaprenyl-diphosphatase